MPHPKDVITGDVVPSTGFNIAANPLQVQNQANTTHLVTATGGLALGSNGETKAIAKGKVDDFTTEGENHYTTAALFADYKPMGPDNKPLKNNNGDQLGMYYNTTDGGDRGMITRQVASYQMDQMLGLGNVAEEKFGLDNNGKVYGMSIQADGAGLVSGSGYLNVDLSNPVTQRGLTDLEVSDYISGQMDRNPRNIFVDPTTGKVTGIDNDLAFPEVSRAEVMKREGAFMEKAVVGMPRMMHQETKDKILNTKPEDLRRTLKNIQGPQPPQGPQPLSDLAIEGAVTRLKEMQKELKKGKKSSITVVDGFDANTYQKQLQAQKTEYTKLGGTSWGVNDPNISQDNQLRPLQFSNRTSYLGAVELDRSKNVLMNPPDPYHTLGPKATKIPNSQDVVDRLKAYNKLSPEAKRVIDADPLKVDGKLDTLRAMTPKQQQDFNNNVTKLQKQVDDKIEHIQHPTKLDKFKAITKGLQNVKNTKQQHADNIQNQIDQLSTGLDPVVPQNNVQVGNNVLPPLNNAVQPLNQVQQIDPHLAPSTNNVQQVNRVRDVMRPPKNEQVMGELKNKLAKKNNEKSTRDVTGLGSEKETQKEVVSNKINRSPSFGG